MKAISTESEGQFFGQKELNELYASIKKSADLKPVLVTEKSSQTLLSMPLLLLLLLVALIPQLTEIYPPSVDWNDS